MMLRSISLFSSFSLLLLGSLPARVSAAEILKTSGFTTCGDDSSITVQKVNIEYNNSNKTVTFDVAGTSTKEQNVTALLNVTAYGISVYSNSFNPCKTSTYVAQLCPVPVGEFSASGTQEIPSSYASMIPSIAFSVPDIDADATLQLTSLDTGDTVACITSTVGNGKTVAVKSVAYVAAGIAGAALLLTGASAAGAAAAGAGSTGGAGTSSPSFTDVLTTFQGFAMNGMLSVNYPTVYRSFAKNFAFSTGLIPWGSMQTAIDNFRSATGGNLTTDSYAYLQNATLVYSAEGGSSVSKRAIDTILEGLLMRDVSTSVNSTSSDTSNSTSSESTLEQTVSGIQAYVEELSVPQANTFMTVLLIVAIVIATIAVGILFVKVILETWALFGSFPKALTGFRKHYWRTMARSIVQLILVLYGMWVLYCIYQFTHGDSWAAKALAGVTLGIFTGVLAFFTFMIWKTARALKKADGDASGLYEKKENWLKYSIFYDSYKKDFWWVFVPAIIYMAAKGAVLAIADGDGLSQTVAQLSIEACMLAMLIWNRPFERRSGNVINIFIQIVRVLSVVCILVFVEELGIAETTQTITGVVIIAIQSALTATLAILIGVNAIIMCCKENPHRKRRKEAEKLNRDLDNLTPLDARNSLLMDPAKMPMDTEYEHERKEPLMKQQSADSFRDEPANPYHGATPLQSFTPQNRPYTPDNQLRREQSREHLVSGAAPIGGHQSPPRERQPTVPNMQGGGYNGGYRGMAY